MEERNGERRKKIVVTGVGGIAGLLILAGAFAAGTLIRNISNKRRSDSKFTKKNDISINSGSSSSSITEDGSEGLRSLLQTSSSSSLESSPRSIVEDGHIEETPTLAETEDSKKEDQANSTETIDEVAPEENTSPSLEESDYEEEEEDMEERKRESSEDSMEEGERESSEGTGDSSTESNSEAIWPAEAVEKEVLMLNQRGDNVQILGKKNYEEASKELEDGFQTTSSFHIDQKIGFKMIQSQSLISSNQRLWLLLTFAVGLLCLFLAHHRSVFDLNKSLWSPSS